MNDRWEFTPVQPNGGFRSYDMVPTPKRPRLVLRSRGIASCTERGDRQPVAFRPCCACSGLRCRSALAILHGMEDERRTDPFDLSVRYYDENANSFAERTADIDLSPLYDEFLPLLPPSGFILDAGCGTGRDSAAFLERGFRVLAFDASKAMVDMASKRIGQPVLHLSFDQMQFDHEFDGVWAAASLLHVPTASMEWTFRDLHEALVPGGILYASFKRGTSEGVREGRFFNDYDEVRLKEFVQGLRGGWSLPDSSPPWSVLKVWLTSDIGQQRAGVEWVNLLARAR